MERYIQTVISIILCLLTTLVVADNENNSIEHKMDLFNQRLTRLEVILGSQNTNIRVNSTILSRLEVLENPTEISTNLKKQGQTVSSHSGSSNRQELNFLRQQIRDLKFEINRLKSEVSRLSSSR
ncbi:MAG: hypothetical protein GY781_20320 [Gammaproteobacteria bacterium]|nr:hypothetical protein [Gammaproteobacteria bacterium]